MSIEEQLKEELYQAVELVKDAIRPLADKFPPIQINMALAYVTREMLNEAAQSYGSTGSAAMQKDAVVFALAIPYIDHFNRCMVKVLIAKNDNGDFVEIKSSNIAALRYTQHPDTNMGVLGVKFHSGAIYEYFGVEPVVYETLLKAESVGATFNKLVKQGGYEYSLVRQSSVKPDGL